MGKEQWFRNFERALADREFAGHSFKQAYRLAAQDADDATADQQAYRIDHTRDDYEPPAWSDGDDVPVNLYGEVSDDQ